MSSRDPDRSRCGGTLVEVMMACLILAVMAIGTSAYTYYTRANIRAQQVRRLALEAANTRLEELRASLFDAVRPPVADMQVYFLRRDGTNWVHSLSDPAETAPTVSQPALDLVTTVQYMDIDGGDLSFDCLRLSATAGYGRDELQRVTLETYKGL